MLWCGRAAKAAAEITLALKMFCSYALARKRVAQGFIQGLKGSSYAIGLICRH